MSKWSYLGGLCWLAGGVLALFQVIGSMMRENYDWEMLSLTDVLEPRYLSWIDNIGMAIAQRAADYIVSMPLYLLLLILGAVCFLFSAFYKGR